MPTGNSVFKELEPDDQVPEYLKHALVAEVDTIRNTMHVVTHFTEHFLTALTIGLAFTEDEESI
ncbi:hypothetical protein [Dyadobacter psychrotolerans]|uniref:Uncharacterized protein n=1 Tax=Dyadobacter psychrotolerans TaxID=2541721 RepID=A0A4R5DET2_9BACT|nr:hypothetical protein [Dyadobacter psychrotolerans]TDE12386.1 hypothetical protein E0F88_22070 [Dyadobacter psychrotolerans]